MPLSSASRGFLTAALSHLAVAGGLVLVPTVGEVFSTRWPAFLWIVLVGFVACSTFGFSLHLYPAIARRRLLGPALEWVALGAVEVAVVLGAASLAGLLPTNLPIPAFGLAAGFLLAGSIAVALLLGTAGTRSFPAASPPDSRPGDAVSVPLFLFAWVAVCVAALSFVLSGISSGPGFGWWIAAVHILLLGHMVPLITAVTLRLVPRALGADPPRSVAIALATLAGAGAIAVPGALLALPPSAGLNLLLAASPEAAFAVVFAIVLAYLGIRAKTPRRQVGLQLAGVLLLVAGGSLGLFMVGNADYAPVHGHAVLGALGFAGLTILVAWFGMIAPFQRISHTWTRRMLWTLGGLWILAVAFLGAASGASGAVAVWLASGAGSLLLAVAVLWWVGTVPVLFPRLNPLPGIDSTTIHGIRDRWSRR